MPKIEGGTMTGRIINKQHLREVLMGLSASGSERPPSYHLGLLHVAMAFGVNMDEAPTQELRVWNIEEAAALLDVIENDK
jgi:hypothetical protein